MKIDLDDAFEDWMRKWYPTVREHDVQYQETRRAFFAGCAVVFYFIRKILNMVFASEEAYNDKVLAEEAANAVQDLENQIKALPNRPDLEP